MTSLSNSSGGIWSPAVIIAMAAQVRISDCHGPPFLRFHVEVGSVDAGLQVHVAVGSDVFIDAPEIIIDIV